MNDETGEQVMERPVSETKTGLRKLGQEDRAEMERRRQIQERGGIQPLGKAREARPVPSESPVPDENRMLFERVLEGIDLRKSGGLSGEGQRQLEQDQANLKTLFRDLKSRYESLTPQERRLYIDISDKFERSTPGQPQAGNETDDSGAESVAARRRRQEFEQGK